MRNLPAALLLAFSFGAHADEGADLFAQIATVDRQFFDAFNSCDVETMGDLFSEDLEFYHDLGGLSGYAATLDTTRANCERKLGLRRSLVEGSHQVHPIAGYGAIQVGRHTFCHPENGIDDCGTFDFVHLWRRVDGGWKLARVISYGH